MEHKVITPDNQKYPEKLKKRLGNDSPEKIYYNGLLEFLNKFTMGVISSDEIGGNGLMETNQLLYTIREYDMNYIGAWHSMMETEIFRLGLFRKNTTVTLFTSKGLEKETFESFLKDRFYPPLHEFPEREEYFRRAKEGELLIISVAEPELNRFERKNIMERNWLICVLADIVFIPYGPRGSKTYTTARKVMQANIPAFTIELDECEDLHELGIPAFNRKTVKDFLEKHGARISHLKKNKEISYNHTQQPSSSEVKNHIQTELKFGEKNRK
jgi:predicted Rossmann fold nucleotide-binding protein DprA/Smf involved in DNA uptake